MECVIQQSAQGLELHLLELGRRKPLTLFQLAPVAVRMASLESGFECRQECIAIKPIDHGLTSHFPGCLAMFRGPSRASCGFGGHGSISLAIAAGAIDPIARCRLLL